jgi:DNA (cytosine-5)-methyltransferase 1
MIAVRELRPRAFMFENVRGLTRPTFAEYFEHIILQLSFPEIARRPDEEWPDHRARLLRHQRAKRSDGLRYRVAFKVLNASDYGVPQRRARVFIVGFRSDLDLEWSFPEPTHSREALLWSQWVSGEYWDRHAVAKRARPELVPGDRETVERLRGLFPPTAKPWATVRDAIAGLPEPKENRDADGVLNHRLQPGARPYPGHTGSPLDEPAKTLKAGDHGVPGGENMLAYPDGRVRYFTVRESARLQTFPDDYLFRGVWSECMRQIGNAVPVELGHVVAAAVRARLDEAGPLTRGKNRRRGATRDDHRREASF